MPQFPQILAQRSVVTGLPSPNAGADSFGGGIGNALGNFGDAVAGVGAKINAHEQRRKDLETKLLLSQAGRDLSETLVKRKTELQGDPKGFTDSFMADVDKYAAEAESRASSKDEADQLRLGFDNLKTSLFQNALGFEASTSASYKRDQIQQALDKTTNLISADPTQYDAVVDSALGLIDGLPGEVASELKSDFLNTVSTARFSALIKSSSSAVQLDALAADMADEKWRDRIDPVQFKNLGTEIATQREKIVRMGEARAKASYDTIVERLDAGAPLPPGELDAVAKNIMASGDSALIQKFAAKRLAYEIKMSVLAAPTDVIDAQVKTMKAPSFDPVLMTALIAQESNGNPNAISSAGAAGLTQVMPGTARDLAVEMADGSFPVGGTDEQVRAFLMVPENGLRYGQAYLTKMLARYDGDLEAALVAYNGGPLRADNWLKAGRNDAVLPAETSNYYKSVMRRYQEAGGDPGSFTSEEFIRYGAVKEARALVEAGLKEDPLAWANEQGVIALSSVMGDNGFDPTGLAQRASDAKSVADYYGLDEMTVLTAPELQAISETLRKATPEQKAAAAAALTTLPKDVANATFKQLKEENSLFAFAGAMANRSKDYAPVAADIFRGEQVLAEAPDRAKSLGSVDARLKVLSEIDGASAMFDDKPSFAQDVREAADAIYVLKAPPGSEFNPELYKRAVSRAVGGLQTAVMNGRPVLLPKDITPEQFELAVNALEDGDLARNSVLGGVPVDRFGDPLAADDIANEGTLELEGADVYRVRLPDGYVVDSTNPSSLYRIRLDTDTMTSLALRGGAQVWLNPSPMTPGQQREADFVKRQQDANKRAEEQFMKEFGDGM